jgi:hypothetical protein
MLFSVLGNFDRDRIRRRGRHRAVLAPHDEVLPDGLSGRVA